METNRQYFFVCGQTQRQNSCCYGDGKRVVKA